MRALHPIKALGLMALLASCGNAPGSHDLTTGVASVISAIRPHHARVAAAATGTVAVPWSKHPRLLVSLPKLQGYRAEFLVLNVNGDVVTWVAPQAADISLRNGVLIQTRGIAKDVMSSQAPTAVQIAKGAGTTDRKMAYLNGADETFVLTYHCKLRTVGHETRQFGPNKVALKHVDEACSGPSGDFTNQYWVDANAKIWASIQWISAKSRYAEITVSGG